MDCAVRQWQLVMIIQQGLLFRYTEGMQIGGFEWTLVFQWHNIPDRLLKTSRKSDPIPSPTMAGGLFAIGM